MSKRQVYHQTGLYPIPLPSGIGLKACGIIEEVGSEVGLFKVGDRVAHSSMPIGIYSEKQLFPQEKLVLVPEGISDAIASCIMPVYYTHIRSQETPEQL